MVGLSVGFIIAFRSFAFISIDLPGGMPLYVTEASIAITLLFILFQYLLRPSLTTLRKNIAEVKAPAVIFWLIGLLVLISSIGNSFGDPSNLLVTLRNSALFYYSIVYFFVLLFFNNLKEMFKYVLYFHWAIAIITIYAVLKMLGVLPTSLPEINASLICIISPISLFLLFSTHSVSKHKFISLLLITLISLAVVLTEIRQGLLGLICGGLCAYWYLGRYRIRSFGQNHIVFVIIALFLSTIVMFFARDVLDIERVPIWDRMVERNFSDTGRSTLWGDFLADMSRSWQGVLFGVGFDRNFIPDWMIGFQTTEILTSNTTGQFQLDPHNSHLHLFYRIGLIGFIAYLWLIKKAFSISANYLAQGTDLRLKYYTIGYLAALASIIGQAFVGVLLEAPHRGIPFWIVLGICTVFPRLAKASELEEKNRLDGIGT